MKSPVVILALAAAVRAMPQAVTANLAPSATAPAGCMLSYPGTFGLAVLKAGQVATVRPDGQPGIPQGVSRISDGQPQAPTGAPGPVSVIGDGQPQAPTGVVAPITVISDGQPQAPTGMAMPISVISDGQPQAPTGVMVMPITVISDGQPQAPTGPIVMPISVISDGQPQAPTGAKVAPVSVIGDGQPQAPTGIMVMPVSAIGDGQPQAPTGTLAPVSRISDGQVQASATAAYPSGYGGMIGCNSTSSLILSLANGVLTDSRGQRAYIASNDQFQFNVQPQAGSIYTSGFSVCNNGSLALGGSTVFYRCLSSDKFYNLYDKSIGGQCEPITLNAIKLVTCMY